MDSFNPYLPILVFGASLAYGLLLYQGKKNIRKSARQATLKDYAIVGVVIVALIGTFFSLRSSDIDENKQMLRDQFALSNDIEMIDFERKWQSRNGTNNYTRGVFRFTDAQLLAYKNKTHDLSQWPPIDLPHGGNDLVADYTAKARRWTAFPKPLRVAMIGKKNVRELPVLDRVWSASNRETIKRGRIMCYVFEEADKNQRSLFGYKGRYRASACSEVPRSPKIRAMVLGILDYDRRTLTITVT